MTSSNVFDVGLLIQCAEDALVPSISTPCVPPRINVDVTHLFTTTEVFPEREDLINWAQNVAKANGFVLVIARSDKGETGFESYVTLMCDRHGVYKPYKDPSEFKYKTTSSKKIDCPFKLRGVPIKSLGGWILKVKCGEHNHAASENLVGHSYAGRLTKEEKAQVESMANNWVAPRHMLDFLKSENPENKSTIGQVYNFCKTRKRNQRGTLTEMQHLAKKIQEGGYVNFARTKENSEEIIGLFWAHPNAIKLYNAFPDLVIMDCTYKTNKYRIPLLEIVGFTSIGLTFCIAFRYMTHERTDDYSWALEQLKSLLSNPANLPKVIVTDKALALLNAIEQIFPTSTHLLCRWHINKNVQAKCTLHIGKSNFADEVMESWKELIDARTVGEFEGIWTDMKKVCKNYPKLTFYLSMTWLKHKEKFVKAWTNSVMHFGTLTSNRVEGAHSSLKNMLKNSEGDFCDSWDAIHRLSTLQHNAITSSFTISKILREHRFMDPYYANVRGFVSRKALRLMHTERDRKFEFDEVCDCTMKVTHGLPCTCALSSFEQIPYEAVHPFWKRLSWAEVRDADEHMSSIDSLQQEWHSVLHLYKKSDEACKNMIRRKMKQIHCPESCSFTCPPIKIKTKGKEKKKKPSAKDEPIGSLRRDPSYFEHIESMTTMSATPIAIAKPRKSKGKKSVPSPQPPTPMLDFVYNATTMYKPMLPAYFQEYVYEVVDVIGDGNCGYRAVALGLGCANGEDD